MLSPSLLLAFFLQVALLCRPCSAETFTYQWDFADSAQQISSSLPECQTLKLAVTSSSNNFGTPPYYVIAFEAGGFSTTSLVGTVPSNLSWQVNHAAGSQLLLSMVDSKGNAGGMSTPLFTVTNGQSTSCLPPQPPTNLVITPNVTMDLATCQPWGLTVTGGTAPYYVTLASVGSETVTNITLPPGFDVLTFINRANPNGQILAAVSDSTGQFGKTTQVVNTVGSASDTCVGLVSEPGQSSRMRSSQMSHRTGIIVGICASVGGLLAILGFLFFRRRRQVERGIQNGQDTLPRSFKYEALGDGPQTALLPLLRPTQSVHDAHSTHSVQSHHSNYSNSSYQKLPIFDTMGPHQSERSSPFTTQEIIPYMPSFRERSDMGHRAQSSVASSSYSHQLGTPSPMASPLYGGGPRSASTSSPSAFAMPSHTSADVDADRRLAKVAEAYRSREPIRLASPRPSIASGRSQNHTSLPSPSSGSQNQSIDPDAEPDIIIQHRDGGVVQELPPPYLDRSRGRPPPPNNNVGS